MNERGLREVDGRVAWSRNAKGKGLRWRMIRDLIGVCSCQWMTTQQVQSVMRKLWGLKNKTTRDLLEEMEQDQCVKQERDDKTGQFKWGTTQAGVIDYLKGSRIIPAGLVEVVENTLSVSISGG